MKAVRGGLFVVILVSVVAGPVSAAGAITLKLAPKRPTTSDTRISVSFVVKKQLPKRHHYTSTFIIDASGDGFCPALTGADSKKRPAKGKTVRLSFNSHDDPLNPGSTWCPGKAAITVSSITDGSDTKDPGTLLGHKNFTLRAKR